MRMKKKIAYALANLEMLSKEEFIDIYEEALIFGRKLPSKERCDFFWRSGMECLSMIVKGLGKG